MAFDLNLKPEEVAHISAGDDKECVKCGHLTIFHNDHCCTYCTIDDCDCELEWESRPRE